MPEDTKYEEAEEFFSRLYRGKHRLPGKIKPLSPGWEINQFGTMATFDFDELTRLVFLAHDMCMRAQVMPSGPRMLKITVCKRERSGTMSRRHPTITQAMQAWREGNKAPEGENDESA